MLSDAAIDNFWADGYLLLEEAMSRQQVTAMVALMFRSTVTAPVIRDPITRMARGPGIPAILHHIILDQNIIGLLLLITHIPAVIIPDRALV